MNLNNQERHGERVLVDLDTHPAWKKVSRNGQTIYSVGNQYEIERFCCTDVNDERVFSSEIRKLSRPFAVILETVSMIYAATDQFRNHPILFYGDQNVFLVGGNSQRIIDVIPDEKVCLNSVREFLLFGHSIGNNTLIQSLWSLGSAEYVVFDKKKHIHKIKKYYSFPYNTQSTINSQELNTRINGLAAKCVSSVLEKHKGRPIVVPFRGRPSDYLLLKALGRQRDSLITAVTCVSDMKGRSNSIKTLTQNYGIRMLVFNSNRDRVRKTFSTHCRRQCYEYAWNCVSLPSFRDFRMALELKECKQLSRESIIVDGGASVFDIGYWGENHIAGKKNGKTLEEIFTNNYKYLWPNIAHISDTVFDEFFESSDSLKSGFSDTVEGLAQLWCWRETLPKTFVNTRRIYEYFDLSYDLPLLSLSALECLQEIPIESRVSWVKQVSVQPNQTSFRRRMISFVKLAQAQKLYDYLSFYRADSLDLSVFGHAYFLLNYKHTHHNRDSAFHARHFLDELNILGYPQDHLPAIISSSQLRLKD